MPTHTQLITLLKNKEVTEVFQRILDYGVESTDMFIGNDGEIRLVVYGEDRCYEFTWDVDGYWTFVEETYKDYNEVKRQEKLSKMGVEQIIHLIFRVDNNSNSVLDLKEKIKEILKDGPKMPETIIHQLSKKGYDEWEVRKTIWEMTAEGIAEFSPGFKHLKLRDIVQDKKHDDIINESVKREVVEIEKEVLSKLIEKAYFKVT